MNVTETHAEGLNRTFTVVVPADTIDQQMSTRLSELAGAVRLPGFRPGKVPLSLVKKRYGPQVMGEVLEQTVRETSQAALSERGLRSAGRPKIEIDEFAEGKDLKYTLAIELMPEIEPIDFSGLSLERLTVAVDDAQVEAELKRIAERNRGSQPLAEPRPAKSDDLVMIDFVGRIDGKEFEGGAANDYELGLGSKSFVPGFEDQLIGAASGESRAVTIQFPAEYAAKDLAGKTAVFQVTVKEIRELGPLKLDDELAKSVGADNLDGLKRMLRERLERHYQQMARMRLKRKLLDVLAEKHDFPVPAGMVGAEYDSIVEQVTRGTDSAAAAESAVQASPGDAGTPPAEPAAPAAPQLSDTEQADFRQIAQRRVRLGLLLSEVGRRNNIQVSEEEMRRALAQAASRNAGREREVIEFYQNHPDAMAALRAPLYEEKVVDFILEMAQVSERSVAIDELMKEEEAAEPAA
ncbi:MAG: trigger factor [Proteobacteria bacterium]|nr:trigger factor [Pseudomonadota bacterium]MBI3498923.1 trigger factor [Pseudomonadota bacterium]